VMHFIWFCLGFASCAIIAFAVDELMIWRERNKE
jgi:hypothetical protein